MDILVQREHMKEEMQMTFEEYCVKMKELLFSRKQIAFRKLKELIDEEGELNKGEHWAWPDAIIHITLDMFLESYMAGLQADLSKMVR